MDTRGVFAQGNINETVIVGWNSCYEDTTYDIRNIVSYKNYADYLISQERPNEFVYAIIFCYRRYLELVLKNVCRICMVKEDFYESVNKSVHNLLVCWADAKKYLSKIADDDLLFMERTVIDLNNLDPYFLSFIFVNDERYADDTNIFVADDTNVQKKSLKINLANLKYNIDGFDSLISYTYCN